MNKQELEAFTARPARVTVKRSDWKHDVHAYECYSCDQRGTAPKGNPHCTGCINRPTRPHWAPHPDYAQAADTAISKAMGKA